MTPSVCGIAPLLWPGRPLSRHSSVSYGTRRGLGAGPWLGPPGGLGQEWGCWWSSGPSGVWGLNCFFTRHLSPPLDLGVLLTQVPQGRDGCIQKGLVLEFTLTPHIQALNNHITCTSIAHASRRVCDGRAISKCINSVDNISPIRYIL